MCLIINCDDFGMSEEINLGVLDAYSRNVVFSASLLVTGSAVEHALGISQDCPNLGVSLHINLDPMLGFGPGRHQGKTINDIDATYLRRAALSPREIQINIEGQIEKALKLGFKLTHLDGHHHAHLFPGILEQAILVAKQFDITRLRFFENFYEDRRDIFAAMKTLLSKEAFRYPDEFIDFSELKSINQLALSQSHEIMVHIANDPTNVNDWRVKQYERLLSKEFRRDLIDSEYRIANFAAI